MYDRTVLLSDYVLLGIQRQEIQQRADGGHGGDVSDGHFVTGDPLGVREESLHETVGLIDVFQLFLSGFLQTLEDRGVLQNKCFL